MHVSLFGNTGVGKSSLIIAQQGLSLKSNTQHDNSKLELAFTNDKRNYGIYFHSSKDKWLVLEELTEKDQEDYLNLKIDLIFDNALFMYDSSSLESCQHTTNLMTQFLKLNIEKPSLLVGSKADLIKSLTAVDKKKIENHISSLGFPVLPISTKGNEPMNQFFVTVISNAIRGYVPPFEWSGAKLLTLGVLGAFLVGIGYFYINKTKKGSGFTTGLFKPLRE